MKKCFGLVLFLAALALASCGKNNQDNDIPTELRTENALSKRVNKLIDNIDKLPDTTSVYGSSETVKLSAETEYFDSTTPSDEYYNNSNYNAYFRGLWEEAESVKEEGLYAKELALKYVKEFDTWIQTNHESNYKISYDKVLDEVHIGLYGGSKINGGEVHRLTEVTSGYTLDGKVSIKVKYYWDIVGDGITYFDNQWHVSTISYIEDEKWIYTFRLDGNHGSSHSDQLYVVESNLVTNKITQLFNTHYYGDDFDDLYGFEVAVQDTVDDYIVVAGSTEYGPNIRIYDKDGHDVINYIGKDDVLAVNLYQCNGLEKATCVNPYLTDGDEQEVIINGVDYRNYKDEIAPGIHPYASIYPQGDGYVPTLYLSVDKNKDILEALDSAMEIMDLSFKETVDKNKVYEIFRNGSTIVSEREALDIKDFTNVTLQQVFDEYDRFTLNTYTREQFLQVFDEPTVLYNEQKENSDVYINIDTTFDGSPVFNTESLSINLKNVTATVKSSMLLISKKQYKAVLLLQDKTGYKVIASSNEVTYKNKDMSFSFEDKDINLKDYLKENETQSLILCVCSINGDDIHSISSKFKVNSEITETKKVINSSSEKDWYVVVEIENGTITFHNITETKK